MIKDYLNYSNLAGNEMIDNIGDAILHVNKVYHRGHI